MIIDRKFLALTQIFVLISFINNNGVKETPKTQTMKETFTASSQETTKNNFPEKSTEKREPSKNLLKKKF
jgi:hypothetical protein